MKHAILCDLHPEPDGFITAQPVCTCGWAGLKHDVGSVEGRTAYDKDEREHRIAVRVSNGCGYVMLVVGLGVIGVYLVGAVYLTTLLFRWL